MYIYYRYLTQGREMLYISSVNEYEPQTLDFTRTHELKRPRYYILTRWYTGSFGFLNRMELAAVLILYWVSKSVLFACLDVCSPVSPHMWLAFIILPTGTALLACVRYCMFDSSRLFLKKYVSSPHDWNT